MLGAESKNLYYFFYLFENTVIDFIFKSVIMENYRRVNVNVFSMFNLQSNMNGQFILKPFYMI